MQSYIPGYIRARQTGRLKQAIQQALDLLSFCTLCPPPAGLKLIK